MAARETKEANDTTTSPSERPTKRRMLARCVDGGGADDGVDSVADDGGDSVAEYNWRSRATVAHGGTQAHVLANHDMLDLVFEALSLSDKLVVVERTCPAWRSASRAGAGWSGLNSIALEDVVLRQAERTNREGTVSPLGRAVALLGSRLTSIRALYWQCGWSFHSAAELHPLVAVSARPTHVWLTDHVATGLETLCDTSVLSRLHKLHLGRVRHVPAEELGHAEGEPTVTRTDRAPLRGLLRTAIGEARETLCVLELFSVHLLSSAVAVALAACPRLHTLNASAPRNNAQSATARLARVIATLPALTDLTFRGFTMTRAAFALLAPTHVRKLNLALAFADDARVSPDGGSGGGGVAGGVADDVADAVPRLPPLTALVWGCSSRYADDALLAILAGQPALEELTLLSQAGATILGPLAEAKWARAFDARRFPRLRVVRLVRLYATALPPLLTLARGRLPQLEELDLDLPRADILAAFAPPPAPVNAVSIQSTADASIESTVRVRSLDDGDADDNGDSDDSSRSKGGAGNASKGEAKETRVALSAPRLAHLSLSTAEAVDVLQVLHDIAPRNLRTLVCPQLDEASVAALTALLPSVAVRFL